MAIDWRVAESLDQLLDQLNALAPGRSKRSDGAIGDAAHASRSSDHNPWLVIGGQHYVSARDYTHDPAGGLNAQLLADSLQRGRDQRVKYVIWNRRIMAGDAGPQPWVWRPYDGSNPHTKHLHLSVVADLRATVRIPWALSSLVGSSTSPAGAVGRPVLRRGDTGPAVGHLQRRLDIEVDDDFGPLTDAAVRRFQQAHGLVVDGVVGPATWAAIERPAASAPGRDDDMGLTPAQATQLAEIHTQLLAGWPSWEGGTGETFTPVDYLRRNNTEVAALHRNLNDSVHRKLDALLAARPVDAELDAVEGAGLLTADDVRTLIREALADLGPLHLTTKENA